VCFSYLQNKQGEIKHVYRGNVFIQAKNVVENGGVIVCKAKHVELAGGTSNAVSQEQSVESVCQDNADTKYVNHNTKISPNLNHGKLISLYNHRVTRLKSGLEVSTLAAVKPASLAHESSLTTYASVAEGLDYLS